MKYNIFNKFYHEYLSLFSTLVKTISRNLRHEKFEPEVEALEKIVKPGAVCFDVGAAYGRYALPLSRLAGPTGKVYSFEPGRYSHKVLRAIKWFHRLKNLSIHKLALSDQAGTALLCLPVKKTGKIGPSLAFLSRAKQDNAISETVNMATIDNFCGENGIKGVSFIKCDTEGSEFLVFMGAKETIKRHRPAILAEVDAGNMSKYGYQPADLEEFLQSLGYGAFIYTAGAFVPHGKITRSGNYFFFPRAPEAHESVDK